MLKWLTLYRQPITTVIALLGFALSIFQLVRDWYRKREVYKVSVIDYVKTSPQVLRFLIQITNLSETTLVIPEIKLCGIRCELEPVHIKGVESSIWFQTSPQFPVYVAANGAQILYIQFSSEDSLDIELKPKISLTFEVHSTRHTEQKKVKLGERGSYLTNAYEKHGVRIL